MTRANRYTRIPPWAVDTLIAAVLTFMAVAQSGIRPGHPLVPGVFLMTIPLLWRRSAPLVAGIVVVVGILWFGAAAPTAALGAVLVAALSMTLYSPRRFVVLGILLVTALATDVQYNGGVPNFPGYLFPFALLFPTWIAGVTLRGQRMRAEGYRSRADQLEREQELTTRAALAEERSRIARELHDVVAHHVSVMVVQAGAARQVLETSPGAASEALLAVEQVGREAMAEMRNLLGVLGDGNSPALTPQPGLALLPALVDKVRDAGLTISLAITGVPRTLPSGMDLAAFRIVQEALTNALKYAGGASTAVHVEYGPDTLAIEVLDDGALPADELPRGSGHGLAGMRERVGMYGGRMEAGPRLSGGYAVRVWLPLPGDSV